MPTPFSKELRQAIVLAIDSGMSVTDAADKFQVARRTIYYYLQRARSQMKTPRAAGASSGPQSSLQNYRKTIFAARDANPDLSMRELCELLNLSVSPSTLSRTLAAWRLEAEPALSDKSE